MEQKLKIKILLYYKTLYNRYPRYSILETTPVYIQIFISFYAGNRYLPCLTIALLVLTVNNLLRLAPRARISFLQ